MSFEGRRQSRIDEEVRIGIVIDAHYASLAQCGEWDAGSRILCTDAPHPRRPSADAARGKRTETARRIDLFETIAHVWSIYEEDAGPLRRRRGVNSFQLVREAGKGWRIAAILSAAAPVVGRPAANSSLRRLTPGVM